MSDFRSDRMPSPDGKGIAKEAFGRFWDAYVKALAPASKMAAPVLRPLVHPIARSMTFDLFGFWLSWHLEGGFEGLMRPDGLAMSRSAVYRRIALFRRATGRHPDEFKMPGVTIDVEAYWRAAMGEKPTDTPG